jgi:hypothetical protein
MNAKTSSRFLEIRLKDDIAFLSDLEYVSNDLVGQLYNHLLGDRHETKSIFENHNAILEAKWPGRIKLIYCNLSRLSVGCSSDFFLSRFNDLWYPGDDVLVADDSLTTVYAYVDHEEFVIFPSQ